MAPAGVNCAARWAAKVAPSAVAVDDEAGGRNVTRVGEVRPGGGCVFGGEALGGVGSGGTAEAAVVEGEDIDAGGVEGVERGDVVGEGAAGVVEIEHRGCYVFGLRVCRDVPAVELGLSGIVDVEMDFFEGHAGVGRGGGDGAGGMEEQLPLALVEEEAEGGVSAEGGGEEGEGEGGEEPAGADVGGWVGAVVEFPGWGLVPFWHRYPKASSSGDSRGVPQTRQMTAEQSPQTRGSSTERTQTGHQRRTGWGGAGGWGGSAADEDILRLSLSPGARSGLRAQSSGLRKAGH